jgi:hypothetical protein
MTTVRFAVRLLLSGATLAMFASASGGCGSSTAGNTQRDQTAASSSTGSTTSAASTASSGSSTSGAGSSRSGSSSGTGGSDASIQPDGSSASSSTGGADGGAAPTGWNSIAIGGGGFVDGIVFSPAQQGLAYARTDVGGFYRWDDANTRWIPLTDFLSVGQGNDMGGESIAPDPTDANIVYAAGGTYLTGQGNGVILRSTDQGNTWTVNQFPLPMGGNETGRGMGERLAVDPNNNSILLFGTRTGGLYKSTDSGSSWAVVASFPTQGEATYGLPIVLFDKQGGTTSGSTNIYVAAASTSTGSNLYQTTNGGTTWAEVSGGPSGLMAHHASLGSDGTLWLAYSSDYGPYNVGGGTLSGQVWKYATAAGTWTNVTPATNWAGMAGGISVDAQNAQHVIVSTLDSYQPDLVLSTADSGATWTVIAQPQVSYNTTGLDTYDIEGAQFWLSGGMYIGTGATNWVEALAIDPFDSNRAMYGTGAGVWVSTDIMGATGSNAQGITWAFLDEGLEETVPQFLVPAVKGAFLGAIGDLGGMRNTSLDTYSTTGEYLNPTFTTTNGIDFAESNTNFVVRVGDSGTVASDVAYSNDNGQTWAPCPSAPAGYTTTKEMQSVAVAADGSRFVVSPYAGYGSPAFTTNQCMTWTASTGLPSGALLASDRVTAGTFYATSGGNLYVSTDGGATFKVANTFTGSGAPRTVFGVAGEVWIASSGGLYRFTGAGSTSAVVANVTTPYAVGFGMAATGQTHPAVFLMGTVAGQYGFFRSDDGMGTSWTQINDATHQYGWCGACFIAGDESVFGRVYLTTSGRGYIYAAPPY